ncbi:MAG: hypothetical protein RLZZ258_1215 [Actinomycetota bacterium]|jgi:polar amino acid transport system substrate-binding protein
MIRSNKFIARAAAVASTVALTLSMTAVVSTSSQAASGEVKSISKLVPTEIKKKGKFTSVGANYAPAFIHNSDNTLTGWDVETIREVAKILGLKVTITDIAFAGVVPGVKAGRFDTAMGEIYVNPDRLKQVNFVTTHKSGDVLMVPAASSLKSAKAATDLCGLNLAATTGSAEAAAIQLIIDACKSAGKPETKLTSFATAPEMMLALEQARVDGSINSASQGAYTVKTDLKDGKAKYKVIDLPFRPSYDVGIAVAKTKTGVQFAKAIQAAVNYMIKNGKLKALNDKFNEGNGMIAKSVILTK